jgi:pimeloyl-ACP methyl ester carboxylesterase
MKTSVAVILTVFLLVASVASQIPATWVDPSRHAQRFVQVETGVHVEVLDWSGSGRPLVLLAGLGQTAHIYDEWAPRLAQNHRVIAITRRGFGQSSAPATGYTTDRLAQDVLAVLRSERLARPVFVGNGLAGEELSWIGAHASERIAGLVYIDAAYDRSRLGGDAAIARRIPPRLPQPEDMASAEAMTAWMSRGVGGRIPEAEVRQVVQLGPDGRVTGQKTPPRTQQMVIEALARVEPATILSPLLAIYARDSSPRSLPGCTNDEPSVREACDGLYEWRRQQVAESKRLFGAVRSRTKLMEIDGASTFAFVSHERDVTEAMRAFVAELPK